jgi:hypothetical protein
MAYSAKSNDLYMESGLGTTYTALPGRHERCCAADKYAGLRHDIKTETGSHCLSDSTLQTVPLLHKWQPSHNTPQTSLQAKYANSANDQSQQCRISTTKQVSLATPDQ